MSEPRRNSHSGPQRRISFFERDPGIPVVSATPPQSEMPSSRHDPIASSSTAEEWDEYEESNRKGLFGLVDKFSPRMVLENSGSVDVNHPLLALVQLFTIAAQQPAGTVLIGAKLQRFARPLGAVIVVIGMTVLALGVNRYFKVQYATVLAAIVAVVFGILVGVPDVDIILTDM
ncbi:hypothetical protein RHS01_05717 [Rhizoctonia solani]|uniref:Uncharacterized protein n=1 Tax=Rhizoctonia solani TaxID=456999 RepID=A0A8H7IGD3_9AGAM|nr:hypothetical protein RHS01_05717 [Rhizoctonia solani]